MHLELRQHQLVIEHQGGTFQRTINREESGGSGAGLTGALQSPVDSGALVRPSKMNLRLKKGKKAKITLDINKQENSPQLMVSGRGGGRISEHKAGQLSGVGSAAHFSPFQNSRAGADSQILNNASSKQLVLER